VALRNDNGKIIPSPIVLVSMAEVTLCYCDDEWIDAIKKWFSVETTLGDREMFLLNKFRDALKTSPTRDIVKNHEPVHMVRYSHK